MTLLELSAEYRRTCSQLQERIRTLRLAALAATDPSEQLRLTQRAADLTVLFRDTREVAVHMEHYYDRRHHKNAKFTF